MNESDTFKLSDNARVTVAAGEQNHRDQLASMMCKSEFETFVQCEGEFKTLCLHELKGVLRKLQAISQRTESSKMRKKTADSKLDGEFYQNYFAMSLDPSSDGYAPSYSKSSTMSVSPGGTLGGRKNKNGQYLHKISLKPNMESSSGAATSTPSSAAPSAADNEDPEAPFLNLDLQLLRSCSSVLSKSEHNAYASPRVGPYPGVFPDDPHETSMSDILAGMDWVEVPGAGSNSSGTAASISTTTHKLNISRSTSQARMLASRSRSDDGGLLTPASRGSVGGGGERGGQQVHLQSNPRNPVVARRSAEIDKMLSDMSQRSHHSGGGGAGGGGGNGSAAAVSLSSNRSGSSSGKERPLSFPIKGEGSRRITLAVPPSHYLTAATGAGAGDGVPFGAEKFNYKGSMDSDEQRSVVSFASAASATSLGGVNALPAPTPSSTVLAASQVSDLQMVGGDSAAGGNGGTSNGYTSREYTFPTSLPPSTSAKGRISQLQRSGEEGTGNSIDTLSSAQGTQGSENTHASSGPNRDSSMSSLSSRDNCSDAGSSEAEPGVEAAPDAADANSISGLSQETASSKRTAKARWRHSLSTLDRVKRLDTHFPFPLHNNSNGQQQHQHQALHPVGSFRSRAAGSGAYGASGSGDGGADFYNVSRIITASHRLKSRSSSMEKMVSPFPVPGVSPLATAPVATGGQRQRNTFFRSESFGSMGGGGSSTSIPTPIKEEEGGEEWSDAAQGRSAIDPGAAKVVTGHTVSRSKIISMVDGGQHQSIITSPRLSGARQRVGGGGGGCRGGVVVDEDTDDLSQVSSQPGSRVESPQSSSISTLGTLGAFSPDKLHVGSLSQQSSPIPSSSTTSTRGAAAVRGAANGFPGAGETLSRGYIGSHCSSGKDDAKGGDDTSAGLGLAGAGGGPAGSRVDHLRLEARGLLAQSPSPTSGAPILHSSLADSLSSRGSVAVAAPPREATCRLMRQVGKLLNHAAAAAAFMAITASFRRQSISCHIATICLFTIYI